MPARTSGGDAAVSSVVGTVLMLGITLAVFAGFSVVVLDAFSEDQDHLRADLAVVQAEDRYLLEHRGGDPLTLADGRLLLTVDGTESDLPLATFASQTADGLTWRIGDTLCISGPQPPCLYDDAVVGRVIVVYGDAVALADSGSSSSSVLTYVAGNTPAAGTVASFASAQAAHDSAEATVQERATAVPPGSASATLSGTTVSSTSATSASSALAGDLSGDTSDARALLDSTGDWVQVGDFTVPSGATGITAVSIGFEGRVEAASGNSPTVQLSYSISGTTGTTSLSQDLTSTTDAQFTQVVTADRAWSLDDIADLAVKVEVTDNPNRDAGIDHVYVSITYTTAATTHHDLDVVMDFTGVPAGTTHRLQVDYHVSGDRFRIQVWDGTAYNNRGTTLSASASATWSYTLTAAEYNAGAPRIRLVDLAPTGETLGTLWLDYVRVVTS